MRTPPEHVIVLAPGSAEADGSFANIHEDVYLGGQLRMDAAVAIIESNPDVELTLVGGYNKPHEGDYDTSKKVTDMSRFVLDRVSRARIDPVFSLPCTFHNFVAVLNKWKEEGAGVNEAGILTNTYHLQRAVMFARYALDETGGQMRFIPIAAEDLIDTDGDPMFAAQPEAYIERLSRELQGLDDLRSGVYADSCLTSNLDQLRPILNQHAASLLTPNEYIAMSDSMQRHESTIS